jgi:toxin ParE1/3/4
MKIVWTEPAVADLESIRDYISRDSEHYASRLIERIFETIENLQKFPNKGRKVPEAEQENNREILFQNYLSIRKTKNYSSYYFT